MKKSMFFLKKIGLENKKNNGGVSNNISCNILVFTHSPCPL
jgi:hypothetical protein